MSMANQWSQHWAARDYDSIFDSADFAQSEVFEDAPWWSPRFYRELAVRFPQAVFILLERDTDSWFESLCVHSCGRNPGPTDVHCRLYGREAELGELREAGADVAAYGLLDITEHREHYQQKYLQHSRDIREFFAAAPHRLFHGQLTDPSVFDRLLEYLEIPIDPSIAPPHANTSTDARRQALAEYRRSRLSTAGQRYADE